ncbi:hypothetical protein [Streptomyces sp. NPDC005374]|uniref:hypothetical protein n=1 Tax=Streptomyces sp. NPDC005374 TaxID=3364713 RepID=UPI00368461D1
MKTAVLLALMGLGLIVLIALPFLFYNLHVGSPATRERRRQEILKSFDGRPEVRVPATGAGLSVEQTVWLARRHGYDLSHTEGYRMQNRYLVLRLTGPFTPSLPTGSLPGPGSAELQSAAQQVRKSVNPGGIKRLALLLGLIGAAASAKAVSAAQAGQTFAVPAVIAVVLLAGAAALYLTGRSAGRRGEWTGPR